MQAISPKLQVITVDALLPRYSSIYNDKDIESDLPNRFEEYSVCLHSATDEELIILLITEKGLDSGLGINISSSLEKKGFKVSVAISTVEFIKLTRQKSYVKNEGKDDKKASTLQRFNRWVQNAIDEKASDIHFQINDVDAAVYYRVNGDLCKKDMGTAEDFRLFLETHYTSFSDDHENPGYSSKLPLSSTALGEFKLSSPYISLDDEHFEPHLVQVKVRKQSLPLTNDSADEVWRLIIHDDKSRLPNFKELGYQQEQVSILDKVIRKPKGLILFCGTTGSGKSVSSAVCLDQLVKKHKGKKSIRSVENPVELEIKGVRQWSIPKADGYASAIRVFMRSDPDIISIGEIIDVESANAAAHASLSGHLAFSTLHAGTPLKAIKRLEHYGVDRLTLSEDGFLNAIVIQTLIKKLCSSCKVTFKESVENDVNDGFLQSELKETGILENVHIFGQGLGCTKCRNTGFESRQVVANVCEITPEMRELFSQNKLNEALKLNKGSILSHALSLLEEGVVSPLSVLDECGTLNESKYI